MIFLICILLGYNTKHFSDLRFIKLVIQKSCIILPNIILYLGKECVKIFLGKFPDFYLEYKYIK